jgi:hypothetical protein
MAINRLLRHLRTLIGQINIVYVINAIVDYEFAYAHLLRRLSGNVPMATPSASRILLLPKFRWIGATD